MKTFSLLFICMIALMTLATCEQKIVKVTGPSNASIHQIISVAKNKSEVHKFYNTHKELLRVVYVKEASSKPIKEVLFNKATNMDRRWNFFYLKEHIFEKDELEGEMAEIFYLKSCGICHGTIGEGHKGRGGPSLAGLPAWYLTKQFNDFISGERKSFFDGHEDLSHSMIMTRFLKNIDKKDLDWLAKAYAEKTPFTLFTIWGGDATRGKELYTRNCLSCHLSTAKGNKTLGVPPIIYQPDWYVLRQLQTFKKGLRGHNPKDAQAFAMAQIVRNLNNQDFKDIIAHLEELANKASE